MTQRQSRERLIVLDLMLIKPHDVIRRGHSEATRNIMGKRLVLYYQTPDILPEYKRTLGGGNPKNSIISYDELANFMFNLN